MRTLECLAGALLVAGLLPAAAVARSPAPVRDYPLPPTVCGPLPAHFPCLPHNVDPRIVDVPMPPDRHWADCCRPDVVVPPPYYWRAPLDTTIPR